MNENPPINSGTENSVSIHTNFGSGYFARIIADAARGLKTYQDFNNSQSLIDLLEQDVKQLNNNANQTPTESPLSHKPVINGNNTTDKNIGPHNKTTQNASKSERKYVPLQVRKKLNNNVSAITPKHNSESRVFSKHEKGSELQPKSLYSQVQSDNATTPVPSRNSSDKVSTPFSTTPDNRVGISTNKNTENFHRESSKLSQNNLEKSSRPITAENSARAEKNQFNYSPKQETQGETQAIQKMAAREPMKNTRANVSSPSTNKSATHQSKLHIGEVNIKVIDSAQDQQSDTSARVVQKKATTVAISKSADSRTFLRTF